MTAQRPDRIYGFQLTVSGPVALVLMFVLGLTVGGSCRDAHAAPRVGSYMQQRSDGSPLVVAGKLDSARVAYLATFDDAVLNATP